MKAPRTRDEETEWFGEGGTNDADYESPNSDDLATVAEIRKTIYRKLVPVGGMNGRYPEDC